MTKLSIARVNLNSLSNKTNFVYYFLFCSNVDLLRIYESWLTCEILDSCVLLPNYDIVRCDSLDEGSYKKDGVALYTKKSIKHVLVDCNLSNIVVVHLHNFQVADKHCCRQ